MITTMVGGQYYSGIGTKMGPSKYRMIVLSMAERETHNEKESR